MSEGEIAHPEASAQALAGMTCVVMGIQNRWSIAYAIAEQMAQAGGNLALTYIDERAGRDARLSYEIVHPGSCAGHDRRAVTNVLTGRAAQATPRLMPRSPGIVDASARGYG